VFTTRTAHFSESAASTQTPKETYLLWRSLLRSICRPQLFEGWITPSDPPDKSLSSGSNQTIRWLVIYSVDMIALFRAGLFFEFRGSHRSTINTKVGRSIEIRLAASVNHFKLRKQLKCLSSFHVTIWPNMGQSVIWFRSARWKEYFAIPSQTSAINSCQS